MIEEAWKVAFPSLRFKEEHAGGEYDIDITKYFKLVSSIDQSIFED